MKSEEAGGVQFSENSFNPIDEETGTLTDNWQSIGLPFDILASVSLWNRIGFRIPDTKKEWSANQRFLLLFVIHSPLNPISCIQFRLYFFNYSHSIWLEISPIFLYPFASVTHHDFFVREERVVCVCDVREKKESMLWKEEEMCFWESRGPFGLLSSLPLHTV